VYVCMLCVYVCMHACIHMLSPVEGLTQGAHHKQHEQAQCD